MDQSQSRALQVGAVHLGLGESPEAVRARGLSVREGDRGREGKDRWLCSSRTMGRHVSADGVSQMDSGWSSGSSGGS